MQFADLDLEKMYTYADYYGQTDRPPTALVMERLDEQGYIALLSERLSFYGGTMNGLGG